MDNRGQRVDLTMAYVGTRTLFEQAGFTMAAGTEIGVVTKKGDGDGEDVADLFQVPGRAVGGVESEERVLKDGEGVDLTNGKVNGKCSGWDEPAAISGGCYGTVAIEEGEGHE